MNNIRRFFGLAAFFMLMLALVSGPARAQHGGSGGGGGTDLPTPLVFENVATINGKTPTWSGDFTMGAPTQVFFSMITNLSFSIRGKNMNLPDNTPLFVNLYTSDIASGVQSDSGVRWHCMSSMQVVGKLGVLKAYNNFVDDLFSTIFRRLDKVVITDINGTVLATAHP